MSIDRVRVLIVDDDAAACRLHARFVADEPGFTVVGAVRDGSEALAALRTTPVDLMLLDVNMPGFSGIEVLHHLRTASVGSVDVLMITSARDRVTVRQALSAGVVDYLVKPFSREALSERLQTYRGAGAGPLEFDDSFGQGEIDDLLRARPRVTRAATPPTLAEAELPRGLSATTMERVLASLEDTAPLTARQVAEASGISRATVRRYLDHLHVGGVVDVSHRYGKRGRPELLYRVARG